MRLSLKGMMIPFYFLCLFVAVAQTDDQRPFALYEKKGALGGDVDMEGYVSHNIHAATVNFGKGLTIPLTFNFSSKERAKSPYLGEGWICQLLEVQAVQTDERTYLVGMLGGKALYFTRDKNNPEQFNHRGGEWKGTIRKSQFILENQNGSAMHFLDGLIDKIITKDGRTIIWNRANGRVTSIAELGKEPALVVELGSNMAKKMVANGREISLEPNLATMSLGKIIWPSGRTTSFDKKWDEKGKPMLVVDGMSKEKRTFTWDQKTRHILGDGRWTYVVDPKAGGVWPKITRTNVLNKSREAYHYNTVIGVATTLNIDGSVKKEYEFLTPGPLFRKLHKVEVVTNGKTEVVERHVYDELGNQLKTFYSFEGDQIERRFSSTGQVVEELLNGKTVAKMAYDEKGKVLSSSYTPAWVGEEAAKVEEILTGK